MIWVDSIASIDAMARELALFAAIGFLIGGIDDLLIDLIWIGRSLWRQATVYRLHVRVDASTLRPPATPGHLAIFVAAWHEQAVIGSMIATAIANIRHPDWALYVGCYPNDPATFLVVHRATLRDPRIRLVIGDAPGPTTKAGCLNWLWRAMLADEIGIM